MEHDVTVVNNQVHLHFPVEKLSRKEIAKIKERSWKQMGIAIHLYEGAKEEVYHITSIKDTAFHRYDVPHLIWKAPGFYVSPYAVAKVSERHTRPNSEYTMEDLLRSASKAPFSHNKVKEEASIIPTLGKFILRYEKLGAASGIIFENNISFDTQTFAYAKTSRTFKRKMARTLFHELDHGVETKEGLGVRKASHEEHLAEYFAMRVPYEVPDLMKMYRPAIEFLERNINKASAFTFDTGSGHIEVLHHPGPSPFKQEETTPKPDLSKEIDEVYGELFKRTQEVQNDPDPDALEKFLMSEEYQLLWDNVARRGEMLKRRNRLNDK